MASAIAVSQPTLASRSTAKSSNNFEDTASEPGPNISTSCSNAWGSSKPLLLGWQKFRRICSASPGNVRRSAARPKKKIML